MAGVGLWRWFVNQGRWRTSERLTALYFRFVKQEPSGKWFCCVLSADRLVVEIWPVRRREEKDSDGRSGEVFGERASTRRTYQGTSPLWVKSRE